MENGKTTLLTNPGTKLYVKGLLAADANTVLSGYQLEINPAKYSLFTGKTLEESTGLVYFGGRWYDPEIGRFITVDPAEDGENWYGYCRNNPIAYIDADGRVPWLIGVLFAAGIIWVTTNNPDDTPMELLGNAVDALIFSASYGGSTAIITVCRVATGGFVGSAARQQISYGDINWEQAKLDGALAGITVTGGLALGKARQGSVNSFVLLANSPILRKV
jgi:RHS repeat-associated protein